MTVVTNILPYVTNILQFVGNEFQMKYFEFCTIFEAPAPFDFHIVDHEKVKKWKVTPLIRGGSNFYFFTAFSSFFLAFLALLVSPLFGGKRTYSLLWLSFGKRAELDLRLTKCIFEQFENYLFWGLSQQFC